MLAITLDSIDIAAAVMTMPRLRQAPRFGHLKCVQQCFDSLAHIPHGDIRYRTHEPKYSSFPDDECDWARTVYDGTREKKPHELPKPLEQSDKSTHYVDANSTMTW